MNIDLKTKVPAPLSATANCCKSACPDCPYGQTQLDPNIPQELKSIVEDTKQFDVEELLELYCDEIEQL